MCMAMKHDTGAAAFAEITDGFTGRVLVFLLGDVRCALPLVAVVEVLRAVQISPLPGAPPVVEGVIDVRGEVVAVLDLRTRIGLPSEPVRPEQFLILARADERVVAIRADALEWIMTIDRAQVVPVERIARGIHHLAGVAKTPDGLVLVHDAGRFFHQSEAEALESAMARYPGGVGAP